VGLFSSLKGFAIVFFTSIGTVIAHVLFWTAMFGLFYTGWVGASHYGPEEIAAQTTWVSKNLGMVVIVAFGGLVLGVLCEISSRMNKTDNQA